MTVTGGERPTHDSAEDREAARDLRRDLVRDLDGEVRFDDYTRQLFARDASMYAITPLGVAFPGTPTTSPRRSPPPRPTGCPWCRAAPEQVWPAKPSAPASSSICPGT